MGVTVECLYDQASEELVVNAWVRYWRGARFALAYGKGGKSPRKRVDNLPRVVSGLADEPECVRQDTLSVTNQRLCNQKVGSESNIALSRLSLIPSAEGFTFPLLDHSRVLIATSDKRYDPSAIGDCWLLMHRPANGRVAVELPGAPVSATTAPSSAGIVSVAPPHSIGRHRCIHARSGTVLPTLEGRWECHPACPLVDSCAHRDRDPSELVVVYSPLCPRCHVPLQSLDDTPAGSRTDWRCLNPNCGQRGSTLAVFAEAAPGWRFLGEELAS